MKLNDIKKLNSIYILSDHSSGFDYCELDWNQNVVWQEGEFQDGFKSIEEFLQNSEYFFISEKDASAEVNKIYFEE